MLVLNPPKIAWPLGVMFSLIIFSIINFIKCRENVQTGALQKVAGTLSIEKIGKKRVLMFYGENRSGICNFDSCMKNELTALVGKPVSVKMDRENKIYEIASNETVFFNATQSNDTNTRCIFEITFPIIGLALCSLYVFLNRKNYVK